MYCPKCGKQFDNGARFCKYCGTPAPQAVRPPAGRTETANKNMEIPPIQNAPVPAGAGASKPQGRKKASVLIVAAVIVAGIALALNMSSNTTDSTINSYALPELPDSLKITLYDYNDDSSGFAPNALVYMEGEDSITIENGWDIRLAEDGTMAARLKDGNGVLIYRNGMQIGEISGPVEYFYLSGSGEKIVYGTTYENSYLWNIATGESTLISDSYRSYGITYDGNMLDMGNYYSKNGEEPAWLVFYHILDMSPDGKCVYLWEAYKSTSSDGTEQHYSVFSIMLGERKYDLLSYSDPDYIPSIIACSQDYREVLFTFKNDIYYFSEEKAATTEYKAQHVGNVGEGILLSLNMVTASNNVFQSDDVISEWRSNLAISYKNYQYRTQKSIENGVFCFLKEQNGIKSASLIKLVDNQLVELIPNVTGGYVCLLTKQIFGVLQMED